MPIYASDEHQLLSNDCTLHDGDAEIQDGTLYLTDRRLIYEKKGKRGILHATPAKIFLDINLHELKNVTTAVPLLFGKKILSIEFEKDGATKKYDFQLPDPKKWSEEISRWVSDARRHHEENVSKVEEEKYRKNLEMTKAKAPKTNIGMAYFGRDNQNVKKTGPTNIESQDEGEKQVSELDEPKAVPLVCPGCGNEVDPAMRFCPHCGNKL